MRKVLAALFIALRLCGAAAAQGARRVMSEDDAVERKIMTAQLFPFSVSPR